MRCVAVCFSVLQSIAALRLAALNGFAGLLCFAVWCSVVQCVAMWCSVFQCVAASYSRRFGISAVCCSVLQRAVGRCIVVHCRAL